MIFGLVFMILISNKMIFKTLDSGSFVYLHSSCNKRTNIMLTEIAAIMFYAFILSFTMFLTTSLFGYIGFRDYVDFGKLAYLNLSFFLLLTLIASITVLTSSIFEGKTASSLNIGIQVVFLLFKMISNLKDNFEWVKYLTPFSLFDPDKSINYSSASIINNLILLGLSCIIFTVTLFVFKDKDLSI